MESMSAAKRRRFFHAQKEAVDMAMRMQVRFEELPDVLRPKDVIHCTGLARDTVYALIRAGAIRHVRAGKSILVPKWALKAFLDGE